MLPVRPGKKTELPHTGITTLSVNDRYQCEIEGKYTKAGDMTITDMPMSWEWVSIKMITHACTLFAEH